MCARCTSRQPRTHCSRSSPRCTRACGPGREPGRAQSWPVRTVTIATGDAGTAGKQADSRSRVGTAKGQQIGLGSRAISASVAAAFPSMGGASAVGGRPVRMRQTPSALNDFEHQATSFTPALHCARRASVKILIPAGKMCDTCKVKPAAFSHGPQLRCEADQCHLNSQMF